MGKWADGIGAKAEIGSGDGVRRGSVGVDDADGKHDGDGGDGNVVNNGDPRKGSGVASGKEAALTHSNAHEHLQEKLHGQHTPLAMTGDSPPQSPSVQSGTSSAERTWPIVGDDRDENDVGARGSGSIGGGCGDGAVVVFQLLMQRWEMRPWVAVPRTLVATKEQVWNVQYVGGTFSVACRVLSRRFTQRGSSQAPVRKIRYCKFPRFVPELLFWIASH